MIIIVMSKIYNYRGFEPKASQNFFLDNSVLLFAFAPIGNYNQKTQNAITRFLDDSRRVGSGLYITSLVVSEFTGKVFRDFWDEWKLKPENAGKTSLKKHYRESNDFKTDIEAISAAVKQMCKLTSKFPDNFQNIDFNNILDNFLSIDYNDAYFIELCNSNDWIIVSRDNDIINNPKRSNPALSFLGI